MRNALILAALLALAACGGSNAQERERQPPLVSVAPVQTARFVDRIEAVGTARANEQVTLSAPVTERVLSLNFDDGGYVRAGQVIAVLAQGQETAQLAEAQAQAREAGQQLARLNELKSRGFATNSAVDSQTALASTARAQAAQARATISDRVVRAPFAGWVSLRTISAGAVVSAGTEIATISDLSRIKLDFTIPERLLSAVEPGQLIAANSAAFPDQPFRGTIDSIDPVVNPETRSVTVRAVLPNPDRRLKPGMLLTVDVEAAARTAPGVPELAIVGEGDQSFVFIVDQDVAKRVPVRTGARQGGVVELVEGISPGQRIVTEGVVKISDGQRVRVAGAANARPAAK